MGEVRVVDRGSREIVVFLSGDVDETMRPALDAAIAEVDGLETLTQLSRALVDMQGVTALGRAGLDFLHALQDQGGRHGFTVAATAMSGPAHRALEAVDHPFRMPSPDRR